MTSQQSSRSYKKTKEFLENVLGVTWVGMIFVGYFVAEIIELMVFQRTIPFTFWFCVVFYGGTAITMIIVEIQNPTDFRSLQR